MAESDAQANPADPALSQRARLPLWKRLTYGLVAAALVLGLLEGILAIAGVQPASARRDPFVGFTSSVPHFVADADGIVRRTPEKARVLNDVAFPARKDANSYRIVCVGGSTTYGRPFFADTAFGAWLEAFLDAADRSREWEVINAGGIGYASYRVTGVMREMAGFEPDLFVICTGHNEFLERRTYQGILDMPPLLREAAVAAGRTRIGTLLGGLLRGDAPTRGPEGIADEVRGIALDAVGPQAYTRDDEWKERVAVEFERALHGMIDLAEESGASVVLVAPGANHADFVPFKSQHREGLDEARRREWESLVTRAGQLVTTGADAQALELLEQARAIDDRHAELHFRIARALRATGRHEEAADAFQRAIEEDVVPLRSVARLVAAVRTVAADRDVSLVDFDALSRLESETGAPGETWFADHVHPTLAAAQRLGEAVFEQLLADDIARPDGTWDAARSEAAAQGVLDGIDRARHAQEYINLTLVLAALGQSEQARRRSQEAQELAGENADLLQHLGDVHAAQGEYARAVELFDRVLELAPRRADTRTARGSAYAALGRQDDAIAEFEAALTINPALAGAHAQLGVLFAMRGDVKSAERHLREAVRLAPESSEARSNLGLVLARTGRLAAAISEYEEALRLDRDNASAHLNLGLARLERNQLAAAAASFREVLRIHPDHAEARKRLSALE